MRNAEHQEIKKCFSTSTPIMNQKKKQSDCATDQDSHISCKHSGKNHIEVPCTHTAIRQEPKKVMQEKKERKPKRKRLRKMVR